MEQLSKFEVRGECVTFNDPDVFVNNLMRKTHHYCVGCGGNARL